MAPQMDLATLIGALNSPKSPSLNLQNLINSRMNTLPSLPSVQAPSMGNVDLGSLLSSMPTQVNSGPSFAQRFQTDYNQLAPNDPRLVNPLPNGVQAPNLNMDSGAGTGSGSGGLGWLQGVLAQNQANNQNIESTPVHFNTTPIPGTTPPNATHQGVLGAANQLLHDTGIPSLWNHITGALQGGLTTGNNDSNQYANKWYTQNQNDWKTGFGLIPPPLVYGIKNAVQGWQHPGHAEQQFSNQNTAADANLHNPWLKTLAGFTQGSVGSPISYLPGAVFEKPLAWGAKAVGITPAMKWLGDLLQGTVKGVGHEVSDAAGHAFDVATQAPAESPAMAANMGQVPVFDINEAAGIHPGAGETTVPVKVSKLAPNIAKPGTFMSKNVALNKQLEELLKANPNLDRNALQNMIPNLKLSATKGSSVLANAAKYGVYPEDLFPNVFNKTSRIVDRAVPKADNVMHHVPQREGLVPVSDVKTNTEIPKGVPKAEGEAAQAGAKAAGKGPYAHYAWQSKVGAPFAKWAEKQVGPDGSVLYKNIARGMNQAFSKLPGTTRAFQNLLSQYYGGKASGANAINQWLKETFKDTNEAERAQITHAIESGEKLKDPKLAKIQGQVQSKLKAAFEEAQSRGLVGDALDPAKYGVAAYLPHVFTKDGKLFAKYTATGDHLTDGNGLRYGVDAGKSRAKKGTIKDINAESLANGGKKVFEDDALTVLGHYLHQLNDATAGHEFENKAMGLYRGKYSKVGSMHPEAKSEIVPHTKNGETVYMPKGESDYLHNIGTKKEQHWLTKAYKGWTNGVNKLMFLGSPFTHIVNNLGWQAMVHDPAILKNVPQYLGEALHGIKPGSDMDRALKAGALNLGSETGARGGSARQIQQVINQVDRKGLGQTLPGRAYNRYSHLTPDIEKAYRTAAFMRALEHDMTEEEAANYVRQIMGGHIAPNTMSAAERLMNTVLPFGNWTKTAITSNAKNAVKKPWLYGGLFSGEQGINKEATGHGMLENKNPASIGIPGWKDANGNQVFLNPYLPAQDLAKLGGQIGQNGIEGGLAGFTWSRSNPIYKSIMEDLTHSQEPFTSEQNYWPLYPDTLFPANSPGNRQGMFFGGKGPKINPYESTFTQNMLPSSVQALYDFLTKNKNAASKQDFGKQLLDMLTSSTESAPKPMSGKARKYMTSEYKSQLKKERKAAAQNGG